MPSSVDNRVVQMEFDNDSFEKGIAQSLESLEKIHKTLEGGITAKGLDELTAKVNGLSFDNLNEQLGTVETKANGLVSMLKATIDELGGIGGALSKGALGWLFGTIATGGSRRASNIEQARFQLEGLGVAWEEVSGSIDYAVKGTAYGMDEAAKAAAQFSASGIALGQDMSTALRAISGTAAMTNSSYDEMARIFTTVAGNGRLFAQQLNQLGSRGLNAAAALGKALGVTEEEVREMTSRGEIDFATFAQAMDDAFGEHAKEANKTFSGAFANMKAALSRIGADFVMPIHEMERQVFLGVTSMIDNVRSGLNQLVDISEASSALGIFGEKQSAYLDQFGEGLVKEGRYYASIVSNFEAMAVKFGSTVQEQFQSITDSGVLQRFVASFTWALDGLMEFGFGVSEQFVKIFATIIKAFPTDALAKILNPIGNIGRSLNNFVYPLLEKLTPAIDNIAQSINNLINGGLSVLGPILTGIIEGIFGNGEDLYSFFDGFVDKVLELTGQFQDFTSKLKLSDEASAGLKSTVSGISSVFSGIFGRAIKIVATVLDNVFSTISKFEPVFSAIGNLISAIIVPIFKLFGDALKGIGDTIAGFLGINLGDDLFGFDPSTIQGWADAINGAADAIRSFFEGVNISEIGSKIKDFFGGFADLEGVGQNLSGVWGQLSDVLSNIVDSIGKIVSGDFDFENSFLGQIGKFLNEKIEFSNFENMAKSLFGVEKAYADSGEFTTFGDTLQNEADKASNAVGTLKNGVFDALKNEIRDAGKSFSGFTEAFKVDNFITPISVAIAGFVSGTALRFTHSLIGLVDTSNDFLKGITAPFKKAAEVMDTIKGAIKNFGEAVVLKAKAGMFKDIAIGIALIAGSLLLLSVIPAEQIQQGLLRMLAVIGVVGLIVIAIEVLFSSLVKAADKLDPKKMASVTAGLMGFASIVMAMSVSVLILAVAIGLLSLIPADSFVRAAVTVGLLVAAMVGLAAVVGHSKQLGTQLLQMAAVFASIGFAILAMAAGVLIFAAIPWDIFGNGLIKVVIGLGVLLAALAIAAMLVDTFESKLLGAAATIAAFGLALLPMVAAIMLLSSIPFESAVAGALVLAVGLLGMAIAAGVLSKIAKSGIKEMLAVVPVILAMTIAVLALAGALKIISTIPDPGPAVAAIAIVMTGLAVAVAAIMALAGAITYAVGAVGALVGVVPIMLGAIGVIIALSIAMVALSVSLLIISTIPDVGAPLIALAIGLGLLVAAAAGLALVGPGLLAVGAAALMIGAGLLLAAVGLGLFTAALATLALITPAAAASLQSSLAPMAEGLGSALVVMAGKVAEAIVVFATTLAAAAPQLATAAAQLGLAIVEGLTTIIPAIALAGVQCILSFLQGLASQAQAIAFTGLQLVANLLLGIAQGIGQVIDAGIKLALAFIVGVADGIRNNAELMGAAVQDVIGTLLGLVQGLIADGIESIFGPNPIADAIRSSAEEQIAAAEEASAKVHEALGSENDAMVADQEQAMNDVVAATDEGGNKLEESGKKAADGLAEGFTSSLGSSFQDIDLSSVVSGNLNLESITSVGETGGTNLGTGFTTGANSGMSTLTSTFTGKTREAVNAAGAVDSSGAGNGVGSNFGSGIAAGMSGWIGPIAEKAREMVRAAKDAANEEQAAASPSKDMIKSGGWFGEGFYIGIGMWIDPISKRAGEMVSGAKAAVIETTGYVSDMLNAMNMDGGPVITPVVDLSEVESGMSRMNRLLTDGEATKFMNLSGMMFGAATAGYYNNVITNNYDLTLDWKAGQDANDTLRDLNQALKARNMTGGKHGR